MQQVFMFLNYGAGWTPVNDHTADLAALEGLTVRWGTDSPESQPDPGVLSFTLRDRSGHLAGRAATLAGARVIVQFSAQPTWSAMPAIAYADCPVRWEHAHTIYTPGLPDSTDSQAVTLFDGIVSTGGDVTPDDHGYLLALSATSKMVLWKRLQSQGPTSTATQYKDLHWVGTPAGRLAELNRRAAAAGAPEAVVTGMSYPPNVAPYRTDDYPSQLDLLHRMYSGNGRLALWCEYPDRAASHIGYIALTDPVQIGAGASGVLYVTVDGATRSALDGSTVEAGDTYTVPETVTQITVGTKTAKRDSDGALSFEDTQTVFTDRGRLPANLTATQSSITTESDVVTADETGGAWGGSVWTPSTTERDRIAAWLYTSNLRLRPKDIVFDSRRIDPARRPELYVCAPSGPELFTNAAISRLAGDDGLPAFTGAWTTIGGTLTYEWADGTPVLRHEATVWPLPADSATTARTWASLADWHGRYQSATYTWAEFAAISVFDDTTKMESEAV